MTIDPRFERSVHRWLRAYPRRWRTHRADEMTAVLADLAGASASRIGLRDGLGIVRAGFSTRLRTRPPLRQVAAYRLLGRRLPPQYRQWVRDDIEGALYPLRVGVVVPFSLVMVMFPLLTLIGGGPVEFMPRQMVVAWIVGGGGMSLVVGPWRRRSDARKHLVAEVGETLTDQSLLYGWVMHDRLRARPMVGLVTLLALATAVVGVVTVRSAALGVAVLVGLPLATLVAWNLQRRLPQRPVQPARRLVDPVRRQLALTVLLGAGAIALCVTVTSLATPIAVAALVVLPSAAVAWWSSLHGPDDLALADVVHIAVTGQSPPVDTYREGLVPALLATD
ncbi:hypothetical protein [Cellulomonas sp.]|uniref:hypothetical protein n=1 Tax=Cellulomonas sp. TaxID=40001 RepID=UPI003BAD241C